MVEGIISPGGKGKILIKSLRGWVKFKVKTQSDLVGVRMGGLGRIRDTGITLGLSVMNQRGPEKHK